MKFTFTALWCKIHQKSIWSFLTVLTILLASSLSHAQDIMIGDTSYGTDLKKAYQAAVDGDVIKISGTIEITKVISFDNNTTAEKVTFEGITGEDVLNFADGYRFTGNGHTEHHKWTFKNLTINGGASTTAGGILYSNSTSADIITFENCTLKGATVANKSGGAINLTNGATLIARNTKFINNSATDGSGNGGAIYLKDGSKCELYNCTFTGNTAGNKGGAIHNVAADLYVEGCLFSENRAEGSNGAGVLYAETAGAKVTMLNSTLFKNTTAGKYAAIYQTNAVDAAVYTNLTVAYNTSEATPENSVAAIRCADQDGTTFNNCIIYGNTVSGTPADLSGSGGSVYYSIIGELMQNGLDTEGNIIGDDITALGLSTDLEDNVLKITETSQATNLGLSSYLNTYSITTDQIGNERDYVSDKVDAGAFEFVPLADLELNEALSKVMVAPNAFDLNLNLSNLFTDPEDNQDPITYSVTNNTDTDLVTRAEVSGSTLSLSFNQSDEEGTAVVTVQGQSGERTITFDLDIEVVNSEGIVLNSVNYGSDLKSAYQNAGEGDIIKISGTVEITKSVAFDDNTTAVKVTFKGVTGDDVLKLADGVRFTGNGHTEKHEWTFKNLTINGGTSTSAGGIMYNAGTASDIVTFENCVLQDASTDKSGGALNFSLGASVIATNTKFLNNSATGTGHGGAIYLKDGSKATLYNCVFKNNMAGNKGGAVQNVSSELYVEGCLFTENRAEGDNGGGALYAEGAGSKVEVFNSTIYKNSTSGKYAAIYQAGNVDAAVYTNLTVAYNTAEAATGNTIAAVRCADQDGTTFNNCIIYGNTVSGELSDISGSGGEINYSIIGVLKQNSLNNEGNLIGGDITNLGLSTDLEDNLLKVTASSQAIDLGLSSYLNTYSITNDQAGNTRDYAGGKVDAGAYEFQQTVNTWDGSTWSNGTPLVSQDVVVDADYMGTGFIVKSLTINAGKTVEIGDGTLDIKGDLTNNGSLIIKSGASLFTYEGSSFSGNGVQIERNTRYTDGQYSFVGTVVKQDNSIKGSILGKSIYKYSEAVAYGDDEGLERWIKASKDVLIPGKGYTQAYKKKLTFVGEPNNGTIQFTGTYTTDVKGTGVQGWQLVANPYPTAIDLNAFLIKNTLQKLNGNPINDVNKGNTTGTVYLWDDNGSDKARGSNDDYIIINGVGVIGESRRGNKGRLKYDNGNIMLGAGQGFFVQVNSNINNNIFFTEDMRKSGKNHDDNFFRTATVEKQTLRLSLQSLDEELYSETLLGLLDQATDGVDVMYDAKRLTSSDFQLYSLINQEPYGIQAMPKVENEKLVMLGINIAEAGTYTIDISQMENIPSDLEVELIDTKLNTVHNLSEGKYTFDATDTVESNRFNLLLRRNNTVLANTLDIQTDFILNAHKQGVNINLDNTHLKNMEVAIMDISGKVFLRQFIKTEKQNYIPFTFEKGKLYIIKAHHQVRKFVW